LDLRKKQRVSKFFKTEEDAESYIRNVDGKRELLKGKGTNLIEMSADDFDQIVSIHEQDEDLERIKFEEIIQQRLADKGFNVTNRLSVKEIMAKITRIEKRKKDLVKQITQFINKAQKLHLSPIKIREIAEAEKARVI